MRIFSLFFNLLFFIGLSAAAVAQVCTTPTGLTSTVVRQETCFGNAIIAVTGKAPAASTLPPNSYYEFQLVKASDSSVVKQWQQTDTFFGNIIGDSYKIMARIVCPTGVSTSYYTSAFSVYRYIVAARVDSVKIVRSSICCDGTVRVSAIGTGPLQYALVNRIDAPDLPSSLLTPKRTSNLFDSLCGNTTYYVRVWDACGGFATMDFNMPARQPLTPTLSNVTFNRYACDSFQVDYQVKNISVRTQHPDTNIIRTWIEWPSGRIDSIHTNQVAIYDTVSLFNIKRSFKMADLDPNYNPNLPFPNNIASWPKTVKFYYKDNCGQVYFIGDRRINVGPLRLNTVVNGYSCDSTMYEVSVRHSGIDYVFMDKNAMISIDNGATWRSVTNNVDTTILFLSLKLKNNIVSNIQIAYCGDTVMSSLQVPGVPNLNMLLKITNASNNGCQAGISIEPPTGAVTTIGDSLVVEMISAPTGYAPFPAPVRVAARNLRTVFQNLPLGEYQLRITDSIGQDCSRSIIKTINLVQNELSIIPRINNHYSCNGNAGINLGYHNFSGTDSRPLYVKCITQPANANIPAEFTVYNQNSAISSSNYVRNIPELRSVPAGYYEFLFTDSLGLEVSCHRSTTASVNIEPKHLINNDNYIVNQLCNGDLIVNQYDTLFDSTITRSYANDLYWKLLDSNNREITSGRGTMGDFMGHTKFVVSQSHLRNMPDGTYQIRTYLNVANYQVTQNCTNNFIPMLKGSRSIELSSSQFVKGCGDDTTAAAIVGNVLGSSPEFYTWALYKGEQISQDSLFRGPQASNIFNGLSANQTYLLTATDTCGYGQNYVLRQSNDIRVFGTNSTNTQCPGENVTLSTVNLQGAQLQWYKDGTPIPGATTNVLQLNNIQVATDAGVYTVEANIPNQTCEVLSSSFELTIDCQALPIDLARFNGYLLGDKVRLDWSLYNIDDVNRFEIERSNNGTEWNQIGMVFEAEYQGEAVFNYHFLDQKPAKDLNLYRLKMIEKDGRYSYSNVVKINLNATTSMISIHPNPATDMVTIEGLSGQDVINVYDVSGRLVEQIKANASSFSMPVRHYVDGVYTIRIQQQNGVVSSHKLIKQ